MHSKRQLKHFPWKMIYQFNIKVQKEKSFVTRGHQVRLFWDSMNRITVLSANLLVDKGIKLPKISRIVARFPKNCLGGLFELNSNLVTASIHDLFDSSGEQVQSPDGTGWAQERPATITRSLIKVISAAIPDFDHSGSCSWSAITTQID